MEEVEEVGVDVEMEMWRDVEEIMVDVKYQMSIKFAQTFEIFSLLVLTKNYTPRFIK